MSATRYRENRPATESPFSKQDCQRIIENGDTELLIARAKEIGTRLAGQLTSSQIRNIFGTVRKIEITWGWRATPEQQSKATRQLLLLKPKLAYQAKRERGKGVEELARVLTLAIDAVQGNRERFQNFVDFFEAILAYHTAAGGQ
ncbi:MAG: type III-A CRISPR-associated protein Csm2 [Anaerolineae bacterium]